MMKKNRNTLVPRFVFLAAVILGSGCSDDGRKRPDTSGYEVDIEITRLEDKIMAVNDSAGYVGLNQVDTLFMLQYKTQILGGITRQGQIPLYQSIQGFTQFTHHPEMKDLYKTIKETFPDLDSEEEDLSSAFTYYHYYFPKKTIPRVYTFIAPFSAATATTEETLGIGLDMYLGSDFSPYYSPNLQYTFPQYKIDRCKPAYIVPNAMKAWLLREFEINDQDRRLINQMVYEGKILYAMDLLLPDTPDSLKIGYHEGKIEWCEENEVNIWNHLIQNDLLYSNEYQKFSGILTDGPFSKGEDVPQDSPPMIAVWTGWQIVRDYMKNNPEITLKDLMAEEDSDKVLKGSGYKP